ncbi:MAG: LysR family transcriptional regulator, partial [Sutterella wadsworthensis]
MKIRQIKAFLAIVSTGGVRPAAKKLCLTPSTVAKSIGQLESDLGAPLFERSALNLRLNAADPPSSSSSRAAFSQTAELSALVEEPLFEVDHGIVAAPGHPVLAPDADLKTVFAQSEWLTTVQDEGFLLEKLGGLGISPERVTLCDFFGIDALKGRNDALTLSPLSVI